MSSENLCDLGKNPHDSTRNYADNTDKDLKYDTPRISHTLDVVLGRLEILEILENQWSVHVCRHLHC